MTIYNKILVCCFLINSLLFNNTASCQKDSLFIESDGNGNFFFQQIVQPKQTMFAISREFRTSIETIIDLNPTHKKSLNQYQKILLPIQKEIISQIKDPGTVRRPIFYKVNTNHSIYKSLVINLGLSWNQIKKLNQINTDANLQTGRVLLVGWLNKDESASTPKEIYQPEKKPSIDSTNESTTTESPNYQFTNQQRGLGIWEKSYQTGTNHFALHRTAALNSTIEITNPVQNRTVYAKVIGRIPPQYPKNCTVVITSQCAIDLNLANKKFFSQVRFNKK